MLPLVIEHNYIVYVTYATTSRNYCKLPWAAIIFESDVKAMDTYSLDPTSNPLKTFLFFNVVVSYIHIIGSLS